MALVSYSIPSLWNGVSQQPASLRNVTQAENQINGLATIAEGLRKRPPTQHVARLTSNPVGSAFMHVINRDTSERYVIVITNGDLEAYNLNTGATVVVNFPDGKSYLSSTDALQGFSAVTVADYTFIVNKEVTCTTDGTTTSGSVTGKVQEFPDLPTSPSDGDLYEIIGQASNNFDNYYVQYSAATDVWTETIAPDVQDTFDSTTLPHQLTFDGTSFTFSKVNWSDQAVGDTESSPAPSFIGKSINDVFFYRNRLGFLADESIIMSRAGDFFNFWRTTITTVTDDDPIDVSASHTKVSILNHAVAFNETLLLFSDQTQFVLSANGTLTPSTVRLDVSTEFESSKRSKPVGAGQNVFFSVPRGSNTQVREYFVEPNTTTNDAANITAHVPTYVPQNVYKLAASTNEDILFVLSEQDRSKVYVYKYFWSGDQKVQSSWSCWEFSDGDTVLDIAIIEDVVYITVERADGVYLEKMQLTGDPTETDLGVLVHLDRRVSLTGSYDVGTNATTWTLPYQDTEDFEAVLGESWTNREGELVNTTRPTSSTVVATGDLSAYPVYIGRKYSLEYTFSEQFVREARGNDLGSILVGTFMLRNMHIRFVEAGYFRMEITPQARDTFTYPMSAKVLGDSTNVIGDIVTNTGTFFVPLLAQSTGIDIKIINDSYLPCQIMAADVEGEYISRSKRV